MAENPQEQGIPEGKDPSQIAQCANWQAEKVELVNQLQRLQAEFENYRKRAEKEREEFRGYACAGVVKELIPLLDTFELSLSHATSEEKQGHLYKGFELVYAQLRSALDEQGLAEIETNGKFDPRRHEAIIAEERQGAEKGTIIEVLQKGYTLNGSILRTTKVKVAK